VVPLSVSTTTVSLFSGSSGMEAVPVLSAAKEVMGLSTGTAVSVVVAVAVADPLKDWSSPVTK